MGHLPAVDRAKLLNTNVTKLYDLKIPASMVKAPANGQTAAAHA